MLRIIRITNIKTKLYKDVDMNNLSLDTFGKIIKFYAGLENYEYKIIRL